MLTKVIPYGSRLFARVLEVHRLRKYGAVIVAADTLGEAHVIVGHPEPLPAVGHEGAMEFTRGGPKGGYWKFLTDRPIHGG